MAGEQAVDGLGQQAGRLRENLLAQLVIVVQRLLDGDSDLSDFENVLPPIAFRTRNAPLIHRQLGGGEVGCVVQEEDC